MHVMGAQQKWSAEKLWKLEQLFQGKLKPQASGGFEETSWVFYDTDHKLSVKYLNQLLPTTTASSANGECRFTCEEISYYITTLLW